MGEFVKHGQSQPKQIHKHQMLKDQLEQIPQPSDLANELGAAIVKSKRGVHVVLPFGLCSTDPRESAQEVLISVAMEVIYAHRLMGSTPVVHATGVLLVFQFYELSLIIKEF